MVNQGIHGQVGVGEGRLEILGVEAGPGEQENFEVGEVDATTIPFAPFNIPTLT